MLKMSSFGTKPNVYIKKVSNFLLARNISLLPHNRAARCSKCPLLVGLKPNSLHIFFQKKGQNFCSLASLARNEIGNLKFGQRASPFPSGNNVGGGETPSLLPTLPLNTFLSSVIGGNICRYRGLYTQGNYSCPIYSCKVLFAT